MLRLPLPSQPTTPVIPTSRRMVRRPGERTRLQRGLRPGSYKVTARRGRRHCVGHLEVGSTDHFEGISASPIRGQARAEMARIHHRSPLSPSALGVRARLRDLTDMAEVKEAAIDYPGRLRRSVEGVGVLYKTCSPATRLEDCPSENRDGPGKSYVSELRRNLAHSPPSHISKMVLSTVHVGGACKGAHKCASL